jgi:hypothetical protein
MNHKGNFHKWKNMAYSKVQIHAIVKKSHFSQINL